MTSLGLASKSLLLGTFLVLSLEPGYPFVPSSINTAHRSATVTTSPAFGVLNSQSSRLKKTSRQSLSRLYFFFADRETNTKEKELASFPKLATTGTDVKFEGLVGYLTEWSKKFEDDRKGTGLSTPVKVFSTLEEESKPDADVVEKKGVRIVFQRTNTGESYKNKNEEDASERGEGEQKKKKKKGPPKEGGVQIQVEKLKSGEVRVRAKRCDVEDETTIKEMSEEAIVNNLKSAIRAWSKEYSG